MKARHHLSMFLFSSLALTFALPVAAHAAACVDRLEQLIEPLADRYGEAQMWTGTSVGTDGSHMEIMLFANPAATTWTIVGHVIGRPFCVLSSGTSWKVAPPPDAASKEEG